MYSVLPEVIPRIEQSSMGDKEGVVFVDNDSLGSVVLSRIVAGVCPKRTGSLPSCKVGGVEYFARGLSPYSRVVFESAMPRIHRIMCSSMITSAKKERVVAKLEAKTHVVTGFISLILGCGELGYVSWEGGESFKKWLNEPIYGLEKLELSLSHINQALYNLSVRVTLSLTFGLLIHKILLPIIEYFERQSDDMERCWRRVYRGDIREEDAKNLHGVLLMLSERFSKAHGDVSGIRICYEQSITSFSYYILEKYEGYSLLNEGMCLESLSRSPNKASQHEMKKLFKVRDDFFKFKDWMLKHLNEHASDSLIS